jgi:arginyl-tRNA--protein-N-Asp/Glu arginylyltransferase
MKYLHWDEKTIIDLSEKNISAMYDSGYVFTRLGKGTMQQTRSVRINLQKFELNSENRRIIRKGESIEIEKYSIPYEDYSWKIAKIAKSFYEIKANGTFSANKIKELITTNQNFNTLLIFKENDAPCGYAICYENQSMIHYSYPFYDLKNAPKDMGLIMMNRVIVRAKSQGLSYVYLGSLQRPTDIYKLQFAGLEWFDSKEWSDDIEKAKNLLKE